MGATTFNTFGSYELKISIELVSYYLSDNIYGIFELKHLIKCSNELL